MAKISVKINEKKTISSRMSIIRRICKFWSVNGIKPSFIKVRKVKIPRKMQRNEDAMIQFKFFIILNILNNY